MARWILLGVRFRLRQSSCLSVSIRLKSVKNIQKITKSMKMVAAAKYARAERELKAARPYGEGAQGMEFLDGLRCRWNYKVAWFCVALYKNLELTDKSEKKPEHLLVLMTSDRGLCGAVHSNIARMVKVDMKEKPADRNIKMICVGDKSKALMQR